MQTTFHWLTELASASRTGPGVTSPWVWSPDGSMLLLARHVDGNVDHYLPVNLLTNLDTTGGNSGSPVLDAQGRLIGLNFDSNWEAVSASWMYDPRFKRAIHVDMRYLRWLLAKVYPAPHLLQEMKLPAE